MAEPRIRRDAAKMSAWDPTLLWYSRAVAEMKTRPLNDSAAWRYQAAIHEYDRGRDPLANQTEQQPSAADRKKFWTQCQHNSWFFLPWHRMYLSVFEQIVAAAVTRLGGPDDWALPYWNYSDTTNPDARRLPAAFYAGRTPDGNANPLRIDFRNPGCNDGDIIADDLDVDVRACLEEPVFTGVSDVSPGFGGGRTGFNHGGGISGMVDMTPHGSMHVAVGGWMGGFNTAGLDPVFWLHHANIDRLWTVWLKSDATHSNPSEARWLAQLRFEFKDENGNLLSFTPAEVVETTSMSRPYKYEDEAAPPRIETEAETAKPRREPVTEGRVPEMVGATSAPIILEGMEVSTRIPASPPRGPARESAELGRESRVYLNVENITGEGDPTSYLVYVNLPEETSPAEHPELLAGMLPMFGVKEASRSDDRHSGNGLQYALEVSDIVERLKSDGSWDPSDIRLTFVPKLRGPQPESAREVASANPIRIGRVSLYLG
jgi:tyrosinase